MLFRFEGCLVHATEQGSGVVVGHRTADDGRFVVRLPPTGLWHLAVTVGHGFGEPSVVVPCRPGQTDLRIVVSGQAHEFTEAPAPVPPDGVLLVEVLRSDGEPAPFPVLQWRGVGTNGHEASSVVASVDGHRYGLEVARMPKAPARLSIEDAISNETAWIDLPREPGQMTLRTQPRLLFVVRVRREGLPARGVAVELLPYASPLRALVDGRGDAPFPAAPLGPMAVRVMRGMEELAVGEFELRVEGPHEFAIQVAR